MFDAVGLPHKEKNAQNLVKTPHVQIGVQSSQERDRGAGRAVCASVGELLGAPARSKSAGACSVYLQPTYGHATVDTTTLVVPKLPFTLVYRQYSRRGRIYVSRFTVRVCSSRGRPQRMFRTSVVCPGFVDSKKSCRPHRYFRAVRQNLDPLTSCCVERLVQPPWGVPPLVNVALYFRCHSTKF